MPLKDGSYKGAHLATRRSLLEMLKRRGELSSSQMASELGISSMAVRQHMQELESTGDVVSNDRPSGKGRPSKYWGLAAGADRHFEDRHRDLILELLNGVQTVLGEEAMDRVLDERSSNQANEYKAKISQALPIEQRVQELAELRSKEGYMAEVEKGQEGTVMLLENHCPICDAAKICQGLCARELSVFEQVLGEDCSVKRVEHILSGARRCAYEVRPKA